jgi:hypothetical protein
LQLVSIWYEEHYTKNAHVPWAILGRYKESTVIMTMDFGLLLLFDCVGLLWRLVGLLPTTQRTYGQTLCPDLTVEGQKTIRMYQGYTNVTVAHFSRARDAEFGEFSVLFSKPIK